MLTLRNSGSFDSFFMMLIDFTLYCSPISSIVMLGFHLQGQGAWVESSRAVQLTIQAREPIKQMSENRSLPVRRSERQQRQVGLLRHGGGAMGSPGCSASAAGARLQAQRCMSAMKTSQVDPSRSL